MKAFLFAMTLCCSGLVQAQKIDSIYFHLYTDSLKKGVHNYINVDGKLADGGWLPLTAKEIELTASAGKFEGNDLILPADFTEEKIWIKAILRSSPGNTKQVTVWIKKRPDNEILPSKNDVLNGNPSKPRSRRN